METYRLTIQPQSSFLTPLDADTIFGSLCWQMRWRYGEKRLEDFLRTYTQDSAPFLLSSGLRHGFFPRPRIPAPNRKEAAELIKTHISGSGQEQLRRGLSLLKKIQESTWISIPVFSEHRTAYSTVALFSDIFSGRLCPLKNEFKRCESCPILEDPETGTCRQNSLSFIQHREVYHNTINRLTDTTGDDALFPLEEIVYTEPVDIYFKTDELELFKQLFSDLEREGFGKKKSSGKGQFRVESLERFTFPAFDNSGHFLTLSGFIPKVETEGYYNIKTKRGRLGALYSEIGGSVFKVPLLFYEPGSVFRREGQPPYGLLVSDIHHTRENVLQYAYAFEVGVELDA